MTPLESLTAQILALFAPPKRMSVSEWADAYREMPRGTTAEPGKFKTSRMPFQKEPLDACSDPRVGEVILMGGKQIYKTTVIECVIGYLIDIAPCNILVKYPTVDSAKKFSTKKLTPMIKAMPRLSSKLKDPRTRDSGNTILSKEFPGGSLTLIGANSPAGTRQQSCRVIIQDEIDTDEPNAEGDPVDQADGRAENFGDALFIKASTPTRKGTSRIQKLFDDSDQRYWHVSCPRCSCSQTLKFGNIRYKFIIDGKEEIIPENAVYICEGCKAELTDVERIKMVMGGKWVARFPSRARRGYHLSGMYRIMGKKRAYKSYLHEFVAKYLEAKEKGESAMQVWINTFLAECYEPEMAKLDVNPIIARREAYGPALPRNVLVLTATVDSQIDRLELLIGGWCIQDEWYGVKLVRLMGDPFDVHVWKNLDELLNEPIEHPVFGSLRVKCTLIDSGGQINSRPFTIPVYNFVRPRQPTENGPGVYACKGANVYNAELVSTSKPANGICLKRIGTTAAKSTLHARLKLSGSGPRRIHFPDGQGFDRDFFDQLGAEAPREEKRHGYTYVVWEKIDPNSRNEGLDLMAYQIAAKEVLNADLPTIQRKLLAREVELNKSVPAAIAEQQRPSVEIVRPVRPLPRAPQRRFKLHRPGFKPSFR